MKRLIIIMVLLLPSLLYAAPFLVCDPQAGISHYKLTGPAWTPPQIIAQPDGSIKLDVAASIVGSNALTVAACVSDPVWGERCSLPAPFTFTRPAAPATISNIRLIQ